jgi:PAS domain S-box-containing protein
MPRARVLIADDDFSMARNVRERLEQMEYEVCSVVSYGAEAIKQAEMLKPDIVLMDVVLQGDIDGIDAAQEIRSRWDIPIIYLTACTHDELVERAKLSEPYGYIVEPVEADELKAAIEVALHKHVMDKKLQQQIAQHKLAEEALQKYSHDLLERNKELNCLYNISKAIEQPNGTLPDILKGIVEVISSGLQYPEVSCARIIIKNGEYKSRNFKESEWSQLADVSVMGEIVGRLEVYYLEQKRLADEGVFLKEERSLIDAIAERLGRILERKLAGQELLESEERLKFVLQGSGLGFWDWNVLTGEVQRNERWAEMLGYALKEVEFNVEQGKTLIHPDDRDRVLKSLDDHLNGLTEVYINEYRMLTKDGQYKWVLDRGKIVKRDEHGRPTRISGTKTDMTQHKLAGDAMRKSESFLNNIVENIPDMIFVKDAKELRFLKFNKAGEDLLGYSREELIGKNDYDFFPKSEADFFTENDKKVLMDKALRDIPEETIQTRHKGKRILHTKKIPICDEQGNPEYLLGISEDITQHKLAEQEKERLEAKLQQAQKLEAIGTLAGGIAHDFNNILGIIMGYTEMAKPNLTDNSEEKGYINEVLKACHRAKDLVKQILIFSRMEGKLEREPVHVGALIKETVKFLRATLPATIEIRADISSNKNLLISANAIQIHQLLTNLCTNAAHAMEQTGGILEVILTDVDFDADNLPPHPDMKPGHYFRLKISDTGHGMDSWTLERIFDPYFTTKEVGKGTGLGLAVVQGIVNRYEGTIFVHSEKGKGATFDIYLPIIEIKATTKDEVQESLPRGTERILFIEDEAALADLGKKRLETLGYEVVAKSNSVEALELFRSQPDRFDLVITDYTMPNMTGEDVAKEMMKIRPDIQIILCTGYNESITEGKALDMGICAYLMKPVAVHDIAEAVRRALDKK